MEKNDDFAPAAHLPSDPARSDSRGSAIPFMTDGPGMAYSPDNTSPMAAMGSGMNLQAMQTMQQCRPTEPCRPTGPCGPCSYMAVCPTCGKSNRDARRFCSECGTKLFRALGE